MTNSPRIHPQATVETDHKSIGEGAIVDAYAILRKSVVLGKNVVVHPHVVIEANVEIGDGVEIFPYAYVGKLPKGAGALARVPEIKGGTYVGASSSTGPHAVIYQNVQIGENCLIGDTASIREACRIGKAVAVGRRVTLSYAVVLHDRVKIMDHGWLGDNQTIGEGAFTSGLVGMTNDNAMGRNGYDELQIQGPSFGANSRIGAGAQILPNIKIGNGAIVAAGAVVTHDVDVAQTLVGIPARPRRSS